MIAANKIHPARRSRAKSARRSTKKVVPVTIRKSTSGSYADTQIASAHATALVKPHARRRHGILDSPIASIWSAIWVSAYEPLVLFLIVTGTTFFVDRRALFARDRRAGWILFAAIIAIAVLIEQRFPSFAIFQSNAAFKNWARAIGELAHVSPANPVWLRWCGYLLLAAPLLIWMNFRTRKDAAHGVRALPIYVLLVATY